MTVPEVLFGMRKMPAPLHTGQRLGRRGDPEASPMSSSVGDVEAVRKSRRQKAAVHIALPFREKTAWPLLRFGAQESGSDAFDSQNSKSAARERVSGRFQKRQRIPRPDRTMYGDGESEIPK